ncbi:MAG: DNA gyrase inhibitor YacG [Caulobacteraceae bacterium]|nr:DNA gyrase inhibitor YacG [Caulobacteraceae bacterium]
MTSGRCPICGKPTAPAFRPFCSKRCADVDLQRWFSGAYAIPVANDGEEAGEEPFDEDD